MVDFTKDIMGGQGPVALGESLLSQARQRTDENRRRRDKNAEKMLLATLGGKLVGSFLNKKFDNDLQAHLNSKDALAERALVRSSVENANRITEQERAANTHKAGRSAYYMEALTERTKAYINANAAKTGIKYNESDIDVLARQEAANHLEEYMRAIDKQVAAAKSLVGVTGGDTLIYGKAIREAAGEGENILGRLGRRLATTFSKDNPGNSKDAIYRSTTTSQIYKTSEQFKTVFDSTLNITGDAAIATRAAKAFNDGTIRQATGKSEDIKNIKLPDGRDMTVLVQKDTDGNIARFVPISEDSSFFSGENYSALTSSARNLIPSDRAAPMVAATLAQIEDEDLKSKISKKTVGETEAQTKTRTRLVASDLSAAQRYLKRSFGDAMTESSVSNISARMHELDYDINGARKEIVMNNVFLAAAAIDQEYDGLENAPIAIQKELENNLSNFFDNETGALGTMSTTRIEEIAAMFDKLDYSFTSQLNFEGYEVADILALAHQRASVRDGYASLPKEELMPSYSRKQDGSRVFSSLFSTVN